MITAYLTRTARADADRKVERKQRSTVRHRHRQVMLSNGHAHETTRLGIYNQAKSNGRKCGASASDPLVFRQFVTFVTYWSDTLLH